MCNSVSCLWDVYSPIDPGKEEHYWRNYLRQDKNFRIPLAREDHRNKHDNIMSVQQKRLTRNHDFYGSLQQGSLFFFSPKIGFLKPNIWDLSFSKNVDVVFIEKSDFFLKSPCFLQKPLVFEKICILIIQNVCFQPFAGFLDQQEAKSLEMRTILTKPNQGSLKFICDSYSTS